MMRPTMSRRLVAAAFSVASVLAMATPTLATASVVTGSVSGLNVADTKECGTVGVTIVVNQLSASDEVAGTTVRVDKLPGFDLSTQEAWDRLTSLDTEAARALTAELTRIGVTGADGTVSFGGLPVGVYLVTGTAPQDGKHHTPAPFVITLPTGGENGWNCAPVINAKFEPDAPQPPKPSQPSEPSKPPLPPIVPIPIPIPLPGPPAPPVTVTPTVPAAPATPTTVAPMDREDSVRGVHTAKQLAATGASILLPLGIAAALLLVGVALRRKRQ